MPAHLHILASRMNGTLYTGSTTDLIQRLEQHRAGVPGSSTAKYGVKMLVYLEEYDDIRDARRREAQIKKWHRAWKLELIESLNPEWRDLADNLQH